MIEPFGDDEHLDKMATLIVEHHIDSLTFFSENDVKPIDAIHLVTALMGTVVGLLEAEHGPVDDKVIVEGYRSFLEGPMENVMAKFKEFQGGTAN